jgi:hypothetical protein
MDPLRRRPERRPPRPLSERPRRRSLVCFRLHLLLFAVLPAAVAAAPLKQDWRIEPFEWHGSLGAGRVLAVRNPYGDVRARRADGATTAVYAAMQRHRGDLRAWTISIAESADGLAVEVVLAGGAVPAAAAADWLPRRVDLTVYVPAGAKLRVETADGLIEAKRLGGDVEARSAGGEIVITTAGSVDARSDAGRIRYSFLDHRWVGSARLVTRSGDIILTLPSGANADLAIQTRGEISTGGALAPRAGATSRHGLAAVLGAGGNLIAVESESGRVEVQQIRS